MEKQPDLCPAKNLNSKVPKALGKECHYRAKRFQPKCKNPKRNYCDFIVLEVDLCSFIAHSHISFFATSK